MPLPRKGVLFFILDRRKSKVRADDTIRADSPAYVPSRQIRLFTQSGTGTKIRLLIDLLFCEKGDTILHQYPRLHHRRHCPLLHSRILLI
jgi:hypothetical protein